MGGRRLVALLLRKVRDRRGSSAEGLAWLDAGEIPADPLADLTTQENALSLWQVEDDRGNLHRVIAAMAATCDDISHFDYALFDKAIPAEIGIDLEAAPGETPDAEANAAWHYNLVHLSGSKIVELARLILRDGERDRINQKQVKSLLAQAVAAGNLEIASLKPKIRAKIGPAAKE